MIRKSFNSRTIRSYLFSSSRSYISIPDILGQTEQSRNTSLSKAKEKESLSTKPQAVWVKGRFHCPWDEDTKKNLSDVIRYMWTRTQERLKLEHINVHDSRVLINSQRVNMELVKSTEVPHMTWIGHATCFYQTDGVRILTDPLFSDRASPSQSFGPERFVAPPVEIEDLPIDIVLLSHTHYDHLDEASARRIGNRALWVVPLGVKEVLRGMGITNCVELDWWQTYCYKHLHSSSTTNSSDQDPHSIRITFTPAKHWTARTFWDRNTCLWGSFAVQSQQSSFFFTGDTAYCDVFKKIGQEFGGFDIAAIPIGAYSPRWFMKNVHCDPTEAVQIHQDLKSRESVAIHWGTFGLADEDFVEPALELARARDKANIAMRSFYTMKHGETLRVGKDAPKFDFATINMNVFEEYLKHGSNGIYESIKV